MIRLPDFFENAIHRVTKFLSDDVQENYRYGLHVDMSDDRAFTTYYLKAIYGLNEENLGLKIPYVYMYQHKDYKYTIISIKYKGFSYIVESNWFRGAEREISDIINAKLFMYILMKRDSGEYNLKFDIQINDSFIEYILNGCAADLSESGNPELLTAFLKYPDFKEYWTVTQLLDFCDEKDYMALKAVILNVTQGDIKHSEVFWL